MRADAAKCRGRARAYHGPTRRVYLKVKGLRAKVAGRLGRPGLTRVEVKGWTADLLWYDDMLDYLRTRLRRAG